MVWFRPVDRQRTSEAELANHCLKYLRMKDDSPTDSKKRAEGAFIWGRESRLSPQVSFSGLSRDNGLEVRQWVVVWWAQAAVYKLLPKGGWYLCTVCKAPGSLAVRPEKAKATTRKRRERERD